jgi:hypothetical protein
VSVLKEKEKCNFFLCPVFFVSWRGKASSEVLGGKKSQIFSGLQSAVFRNNNPA